MANDTSTEQMFSDFLRTLSRGALDEDATTECQQLVKELARVGETSGGKPKGKMVLAVEFTWDRGMIDVNARINVTRPSPSRAREVRYATIDGRLTREDERQGRLSLGEVRDVSTDPRDIRTAQ